MGRFVWFGIPLLGGGAGVAAGPVIAVAGVALAIAFLAGIGTGAESEDKTD